MADRVLFGGGGGGSDGGERAPRLGWRRRHVLGTLLAGWPVVLWAARDAGSTTLPLPVQGAIEASGLPTDCFGLFVQPAGRAAPPLLSLNADRPFPLASTTKLVTSLAALDLLGPQFRWSTQAWLDGALVDGRLLGDLIIVGGGDAGLSSEALRAWFDRMQRQGLHDIWGDIVLDRLAFALREDDHASTPPPAQDHPHHARPDALTLDEGVLRVALQANGARRAAVRLTPGLTGLAVVNRVTVGPGCSASAFLEQRNADSRLVVRGEWAAACGEREIAQLALPHDQFTARAVAECWRDVGGRLKGRVRSRAVPAHETPQATEERAPTRWDTIWSEPLPTLIHDMNKTSANLAARSLFLSLADQFPTHAATLPAARARLDAWLRAQGVAAGEISVDNGAGLSRAETGKPRALVRLLLHAWQGPHARVFFDSLPIAGVDGTLGRRMSGGAAAGRAHLKTGTLTDTRALAGYVRCRSGRVQAVAAFVNHPEAALGAVPALDAVVEWVAAHG